MENAVSAICHKPFYYTLWHKAENVSKYFLIHSSPVTCTRFPMKRCFHWERCFLYGYHEN